MKNEIRDTIQKSMKWVQGEDDAMEGWPPNRFMRNDKDYMDGYNSVKESLNDQAN